MARLVLAALLCIAGLATIAPTAGATTVNNPLPPGLFAPTSFWNTPLSSTAAVDPSSSTLVSTLVGQVSSYKAWINTYKSSSPVYVVPSSQPLTRVILDGKSSSTLSAAFNSVPLPSNPKPAAGTDAQLTVWQPSTNSMWEFWMMYSKAGKWHARWGGKMTGVSSNPGYFSPASWGATATGLPLLGGLITLHDLNKGSIDHALAFDITDARKSWWSWPAQRSDGSLDSLTSIPEGTRFRLDPNLDLSTLVMPRATRMIAQAAQRYGMVVRDRTLSSPAFEAEDATRFGVDPYYGSTGWFEGKSPSQLLAYFPWSRLQALRLDLRH